jgi:hypothetical protein
MTDKSTTAISELSSEEINTWSEEWRHECEVRAVLKMSNEERQAYFMGVPGDRHQRGIIELRGQEGADELFADVKRLKALRGIRGNQKEVS